MRKLILGILIATARRASAEGTVPAGLRSWGDRYRVILWCGDRAVRNRNTVALARACRELGVTTLMTGPEGDPAPWLAAGFDYYVENIVNRGLCLKWNSTVRDWDGFVTAWSKHRGQEAFVRDYCLVDPVWRESVLGQMKRCAARHSANSPVLYDIRDELSVTISANPFDYDFSPASLAAFRLWLQKRYTSLDAINRAWLTAYPDWNAVRPFSTDEIKARLAGRVDAQGKPPDWRAVRATRYSPDAVRADPARWHLAPWCDFRTFMDDCLAGVLTDLRAASRAADPATPVGIEGTQMPSAWGGYDLWKLSRAIDWVEPYDITAARAIFGSFMRGKPILATYGEREPAALSRRLWHLLLEGDCGAILWWSEDLFDSDGDALTLSVKGRAYAPLLREMQSPLARLLLRAERITDPVAIHYSQASIQLAWLFESFEDGNTWHRRFSSFEAAHNRHAALRTDLWRLLREAGWSPQFFSYDEIENGALETRGFLACILPDSHALSDREVAALRDFASRPGNRLLYTGEPGVFTGNGTPRPAPCFPASADSAAELVARLPPPPVRIATPGSGVTVTRLRLDGRIYFALEQRQQGQSGEDVTASVDAGAGESVRVSFLYNDPRPLLDLRTGRQVGTGGRADVDVPYEHPVLLGFHPNP